MWNLFNPDSAGTGYGNPEREKPVIRYIAGFNNRVDMSVPVSGSTGNLENESTAENVLLPESALTETPERFNKVVKHFC